MAFGCSSTPLPIPRRVRRPSEAQAAAAAGPRRERIVDDAAEVRPRHRAMKPTNRARQPAEGPADPRAGAEGNADEGGALRTPSREGVSPGLNRVGQAARGLPFLTQGGSGMRKAARPVLCGGRPVMGSLPRSRFGASSARKLATRGQKPLRDESPEEWRGASAPLSSSRVSA